VIPLAVAPPGPAELPSGGDPGRWPFLQRLRRLPHLDPEPWLRAIESGALQPEADLLAALAEHWSADAPLRLLRWWAAQPAPDPQLPLHVVDQAPLAAVLHLLPALEERRIRRQRGR